MRRSACLWFLARGYANSIRPSDVAVATNRTASVKPAIRWPTWSECTPKLEANWTADSVNSLKRRPASLGFKYTNGYLTSRLRRYVKRQFSRHLQTLFKFSESSGPTATRSASLCLSSKLRESSAARGSEHYKSDLTSSRLELAEHTLNVLALTHGDWCKCARCLRRCFGLAICYKMAEGAKSPLLAREPAPSFP